MSQGNDCPGVDVTNVHFVDTFNRPGGNANYLFRGALPLTGDQYSGYTYNYCGLKSAIKTAAADVGITMPDDYMIYNINLLQWENSDEVPKIEAEYNFFQSNPDKGWFMFWETKG